MRKILQSQKTFANHLDDFLALQQAEASAAAAAANSKRSTLNRSASNAAVQDEDTLMTDDAAAAAAVSKKKKKPDAKPLLPPPYGPPMATHPGDDDPLLMSAVPERPSDDELRALLAQPPLTYLEARGKWDERERGPPGRVFCEVCGYWGRVRCMKCGTRVCALECLETHREECVTRYGL